MTFPYIPDIKIYIKYKSNIKIPNISNLNAYTSILKKNTHTTCKAIIHMNICSL